MFIIEQSGQDDSGIEMEDMACESCEVNNCYELGANETVTCPEDNILCEPYAC